MADDRTLAGLRAAQAAAAAAFARSASIANRRRLRKAQEALANYRPPITATPTPVGNDSLARVQSPGPGYGLRAYETQAAAPAPQGGGIDVRAIQRRLVDFGYRIAVDGVWGPKSKAAWSDFTAKGGSMDTAPAGSDGRGTPSVGGGGAGLGSPVPVAAGGSAAPAAPTAPSSAGLNPADFRARVLAELPGAAAFLNIPDLVPHIQARLDGTISDQEFAARIQNTEWWRTTPQRARAWMGLQAIDPASAERQIEEQAAKVKEAAGAYYVPMADVTAREWSKKVLSGEVPETAFQEYLRQQAKSLFPALAGAIDSGVTVETYAAPYREIAAQTLEINPNEVNFMDPKWSRALVQVGKDGQRGSMTLYDWQNLIKTDAAYGWDRTNQARTQASQISERLLETFGRVG